MSRGKAASALDLPRPDGLDASKQQGAYAALRGAILNRQLPAGSRLPSTRSLAERWQVSRGTLEAAFERLHSEGYVQRVAGSGTRVCAVIPEQFMAAPTVAQAPRRAVVPDQPDAGVQSHVPFVARRPDTLRACRSCARRSPITCAATVACSARPTR